jgi:hypothetical protein
MGFLLMISDLLHTYVTRDYTLQITITHRPVFSTFEHYRFLSFHIPWLLPSVAGVLSHDSTRHCLVTILSQGLFLMSLRLMDCTP